MDSTILHNFQKSISKQISNLKLKKETINILRAEYAVLAQVNSINHYGIEGLKTNMLTWLIENIKQIIQLKNFPKKESLLADSIKAITNYICITWSEHGA